jgi:hypothetical protein
MQNDVVHAYWHTDDSACKGLVDVNDTDHAIDHVDEALAMA